MADILIIGGTGNVGRELVKQLAAAGEHVRAGTRDPGGLGKRADDVAWIRFDFEDPETFGPALEGVDRVFVQAPPGDPESDRIVIPFLELLEEAGVRKIVNMSAMGVERNDDAAFREIESWIADCAIPWTILRPNWFMQNFNPGFLLGQVLEGMIRLPAGDSRVSFVDTRDVAAVAKTALTAGLDGRELTLTGPQSLTHDHAARIISEKCGREVRYEPISDEDLTRALELAGWPQESIALMVGLFGFMREGLNAPVTIDVEEVLGREPISFERFAEQNAAAWK